MAHSGDDDTRFFLEAIDELAHEKEVHERLDRAANQLAGEAREHPAECKEYTSEEFRRDVTGKTAEDLLDLRRYMAKAICKAVVRLGRAHRPALATQFGHCIRWLQIMDEEIERRQLGVGPLPPAEG